MRIHVLDVGEAWRAYALSHIPRVVGGAVHGVLQCLNFGIGCLQTPVAVADSIQTCSSHLSNTFCHAGHGVDCEGLQLRGCPHHGVAQAGGSVHKRIGFRLQLSGFEDGMDQATQCVGFRGV